MWFVTGYIGAEKLNRVGPICWKTAVETRRRLKENPTVTAVVIANEWGTREHYWSR